MKSTTNADKDSLCRIHYLQSQHLKILKIIYIMIPYYPAIEGEVFRKGIGWFMESMGSGQGE